MGAGLRVSGWKRMRTFGRGVGLLSDKACLIGLRAYHSGVLLAGYKAPHWLSTLARFSRISYRFLMGVAHFLRARAYLEHPLNERLSAQLRSSGLNLSRISKLNPKP